MGQNFGTLFDTLLPIQPQHRIIIDQILQFGHGFCPRMLTSNRLQKLNVCDNFFHLNSGEPSLMIIGILELELVLNDCIFIPRFYIIQKFFYEI